jgi:hypothetical protein
MQRLVSYEDPDGQEDHNCDNITFSLMQASNSSSGI